MTNRPFFPPIQQSRIINRTIINKSTIDPLIIGKLFLLCIEGKIGPIKEYIIKNGLTVNDMVDTNEESILHKVLQNENLLKRDKIELFRFFEEKNLLKMSYDTSQTTPLHLAVKMQIKEIVEILLNSGHNINALDINGKSPLFYSIIGKDQECPSKKEKVLLEKTKFKLEKSATYELVQELIKFINNEEPLYNSFIHIGNTCSILDEVFSENVKNILEKDNIQLLQILQTNDTEDVKNMKIFDLINNTKMSIGNSIIKGELNTCLKPMDFQQNILGGWGPELNPQNKILKTRDVSYFLNKFNIEINDKIKKVTSQLNIKTKNLNQYLTNIYLMYIEPSGDLLNDFIYTYQVLLFKNRLHNQTKLMPDLVDIEDDELINYLKSDDTTPIIFESREIDSNESFNVTDDDDSAIIVKRPDFSNISISLYNILKDSIDKNFENTIPPYINNGDFYIKKCNVIYKKIDTIYNNIDTIKSQIYDELNKTFDLINSNDILLNCIKLQKEILSLLNYLVLIEDEVEPIYLKNTSIIEYIKTLMNNMIGSKIYNGNGYNGNGYIDGDLFFSDILSHYEESEDDYDPIRIKNFFSDIYETIKDYYIYINDIIELLNYLNSTKYIRLYYNNFEEFDDFFTKENTDNIDNIFNKQISTITSIPSNLNNFKMLLSNDVKQNKKTLIETFLYQIHSNSFNSYYKNINQDEETLPIIGFLLEDNIMDKINIVNAPNKLNLLFGEDTPDNKIILKANDKLSGKLGMIKYKKFEKKYKVIPVIGKKLSEHFNIIKYYIIRYILNKSFDLLNTDVNKINEIDDKYKSYYYVIKKMYNNILSKLKLNSNDYGPILIIIGSCIDNIIISNIENSIITGINRFSYKTNRNKKTDIILDLLSRIKTNNPKELHINNFDIANYLKDKKFLVEDIRINIKKVLKESKNAYLFNYAEDIFDKKIDEIKIFKKFSQNILDNNPPTCYSLDYDIIDILIKNNANVSIKDKEGSSIMFSAIDMNNFELVNKIIPLVPVYNKHSKNIFGKTPLQYSKKHLLYFTEMFLDENIIKDLVKISSELVSKKTQVSLQLRYHNEIYKIILILINHYIYSMGKEYINGWTNSDQKILDNFLKMGDIDIPLIKTLEKLDLVDIDKFLLKYIQNDIDNIPLYKSFKDKTEQINNLNEEKRNHSTNQLRKIIIDKTIKTIEDELTSEKFKNIDKNKSEMEIIKKEINKNKTNKTDVIKNRINKEENINTENLITIYESIQDKMINDRNINNNDLKTYINLWKKSIEDKNYSSINIIENICNFIKTRTEIENNMEIELIKKYFDKIITHICVDYVELDYSFNGDNYILNMIFKIIKHVLSNTICINLINIIQQLLREELRIKYPYNSSEYKDDFKYSQLIDSKVKFILTSSDIHGLNIYSYIMDELIEKVIKINLNLYEDSYDKDNMEDVNNIFMKISKLLESNTVIPLSNGGNTDSNQIMKELKDKIYPYFKDYLDINIKLIKKFIDGYMSSLINYSNCLNIYNSVLVKAISEKNIK